MKEILKYISAKYFFADYAKDVKNFTHKMRGTDGNAECVTLLPAETCPTVGRPK